MVQRNGPNEYELLRAKRMQENNKKLQELGLDNAKDTFPAKKAATKRKPQLSASDQDAAERRRSSRVASLPEVNYEDKDTINFRGMRRGRPAEAKKKHATFASSAAMERACEAAESIDCTFPSIVKQMMPSHVAGGFWLVFSAAKAVESSIRSGNPSLVRMMMPSHVSSCFWMGLPRGFCSAHMPGRDTDMTLVDAEGGQWQSRYLFHKTGLSGGWRGFALDHHLEHGDVAIFELIKPTTIKIEIVRVADYDSGAPRGNGKTSGRQQAKRKTGSRYENVPVQGRGGKKGKRDEESVMESEEEEDDEDDDEEEEEEEEEEDDGEAGAVPSEDQSDSDESISTDRDDTDGDGGSGSESDDAQSTDSAKKQSEAMRCAKLETSVDSGSGSADEDHIEEPAQVNSAPTRPKKKPPPAARRISSNVKSKGKGCTPLAAVKPALAGGRPPKPQAVRNLSNVTKIRKISVDPRYLK